MSQASPKPATDTPTAQRSVGDWWTLATFWYGAAVLVLFLVPPIATPLRILVNLGTSTATMTDKALDWIAPELEETPADGEDFSGWVVTSPYGDRPDPINPQQRQFHHGVDLAAKDGNTYGKGLYAIGKPGDRVTVTCSESEAGGITAKIDTLGMEVYYLHLSHCIGDGSSTVNAGSIIAKAGNSGSRTTGAHLDIRVKQNGEWVPPPKWIVHAALHGEIPNPPLFQRKNDESNH